MPTKIEWTDETWNPITGCKKVSDGCKNCYAERMAKRLAGRYGYPADDPFKPTLHEDKLDVPLKWKKPRRIFVCSMGDLFHEDVHRETILRVWKTMAESPQHTFQVLTKRPERMMYILEQWMHPALRLSLVDHTWPLPNVWLGVTAENQETADQRIPILLNTPAAVRFVSCEPLLGPVDLHPGWLLPISPTTSKLNQVIVGGESGPGARPMNPDWARSIRDQCKAAGVPFFMKQMSRKAPIPEDLMVREYPALKEIMED